jgi:hypothetical protein
MMKDLLTNVSDGRGDGGDQASCGPLHKQLRRAVAADHEVQVAAVLGHLSLLTGSEMSPGGT